MRVQFRSPLQCSKISRELKHKVIAHARDIALLKKANNRLEAQNARLVAQMTEMGGTLKLLINQVALTCQLVVESQS